jgi:hypothetical protein
MACKVTDLGGGNFAVLCGPRQRSKPCSVPHCRGHVERLCDYPIAGRKAGATCSAGICARHATKVAVRDLLGDRELDYCPPHARLAQREAAP